VNATVVGFVRKELGQSLRDRRMLALMFVAPVIQMILLGYALNAEIRNIRLAVVAEPGDIMASRLAERAFASGWFLPARAAREDPASGLGAGVTDAVLVMPEGGLTRALARAEADPRQRRGAVIQLLVDATNSVRARTVEFYLGAVLARMAGDGPVPGRGNRVRLDVRILYNPSMLSYLFMVPAVMVFVLTELTSILTAMALAREKEMGTMEMLIAAPVRKWEILAGKTLP
jgi:ABC-2 type transport system permease protein